MQQPIAKLTSLLFLIIAICYGGFAEPNFIDSAKYYYASNYEKSIAFTKLETINYLNDDQPFEIEDFPPYIVDHYQRSQYKNIVNDNFWKDVIAIVKKHTTHPEIIGYTHLQEAYYSRRVGDYNRLEKAIKNTITYAEKANSNELLIEGYKEKGLLLRIKANYKLAESYFKKAIRLSKENPRNSGNIYALMELAKIKRENYQKDSSFYFLNLALKYAKEAELKTEEGTVYTRIADNFIVIKSYDSALHYINKALVLRMVTRGPQNLANSLAMKATIMAAKKEFETAIVLYDSAISNYQYVNNRKGYLNAIANKGATYLEFNKEEEAIQLFNQALTELKSANMENSLISFANNSLKIIQRLPLNTINQSIKKYYNSTLTLLIDATNSELLLQDSLDIIKANSWKYRLDGDYLKAITIFDDYLSLIERKYNTEMSNKLNEAATELLLAEQSLALEKEKAASSELAEKNLRNRSYLLITATIALILMLLYILNRVSSKSKLAKQRLETLLEQEKNERAKLKITLMEKKLEANKKELTTYTLETIEKNNLLKDIKKKLNNSKLTNQVARQINKQLDIKNAASTDWEEFKIRFKEVDNSFLDNLRNKYPTLTDTDIRIASLIKLGFSSKQIGEFLNNSPASIDVARSKLRKKMKLTTKDNLKDTLTKIN